METAKYGLALCALGLEKIVQSEIERIGLKPAGREAGRVRFELGEAPDAALMRANLCLRCAERVLIEAGRFHAENFDELFEQIRSIPWEAYFRRDDRLAIERVRLRDSALAAQTSVQSVAHKAVYDRLGKAYNLTRLPESGAERSLRIYIESDGCLLGLDSSGEALHRRGYRRNAVEAPLKETVAAGILFLSGWNRRIPLLDPFCGSGTIGVEAALYAIDRAPGLGRAFALEGMPFAAAAVLRAEVAAAESRVRRDVEFRITCSDIDPRALEAARANASLAGVAAGIEFRKGRAEEASPGYEEGYLLCNPPYGERLGTEEEAEGLYRRMGEAAERFTGWGLGFVANRPDFGDFFGYEAPHPRKIVNGAEEQWFHWYAPGQALSPSQPRAPGQARSPGSVRRASGEGARSSGGHRSPGARSGRGASAGKGPRGGGADMKTRDASKDGERPLPWRPWIGPDLPGWRKSGRAERFEDGREEPRRAAGHPRGPDKSGWKKRQG